MAPGRIGRAAETVDPPDIGHPGVRAQTLAGILVAEGARLRTAAAGLRQWFAPRVATFTSAVAASSAAPAGAEEPQTRVDHR